MNKTLLRSTKAGGFATACAAVCLLLWARPATAQTFFAESASLVPESSLTMTVSDLEDNTTTQNGVPLELSIVDSTLMRLQGRYRSGHLGLGAVSETRRLRELTDTYESRDDRTQLAGFGALVFEGLLMQDDELQFVLSSGRHQQHFTYEQFPTAEYLRDLTANVVWQMGMVYRLGFFIGGYSRGREKLDLHVTDPFPTLVDETYRYNYTAWLVGLRFGDPESGGLLLVWQNKSTPAVLGTSVDLEPGYERLQRASIALGTVRVDYQQTRVREEFTSVSSRDVAEREFRLGVQLSEHTQIAFTQKHIDQSQGFTVSGTSATTTNARTEHQLQFGLRF